MFIQGRPGTASTIRRCICDGDKDSIVGVVREQGWFVQSRGCRQWISCGARTLQKQDHNHKVFRSGEGAVQGTVPSSVLALKWPARLRRQFRIPRGQERRQQISVVVVDRPSTFRRTSLPASPVCVSQRRMASGHRSDSFCTKSQLWTRRCVCINKGKYLLRRQQYCPESRMERSSPLGFMILPSSSVVSGTRELIQHHRTPRPCRAVNLHWVCHKGSRTLCTLVRLCERY